MKKTIKYFLAILLPAALLMASCKKEATLAPTDFPEPYPMTQGSNAADLFRYNFFNRYQTKILFDFAKKDYWYAMNNTATLKDSIDYFRYVTDTAQQRKAVEFLNAQWLLFYPQAFKQTYLSQYIFAVDRLFDYPSTSTTANPDSTKYFKTNGFSNMLVTGLGNRFATMTNTEKTTLRNELHHGFLYDWIYLRNKEFFPPEFYAVSQLKYGVNPRDSTSTVYNDYLNNGFLPPVSATYPGYNTKTRYQNQDEDVNQFLWFIITKDDAAVNSIINNTYGAKVKQKYLLLLSYFSGLGIDIRSINTYDVSVMGPLDQY